jgi:hypothetical protein
MQLIIKVTQFLLAQRAEEAMGMVKEIADMATGTPPRVASHRSGIVIQHGTSGMYSNHIRRNPLFLISVRL